MPRAQGMEARRVTVYDYPRLTRFYGISPRELAQLPNALKQIYAEELIKLESEETLLAMLVADMPHANSKDRRRARRLFTRHLGEAPAQKIDTNTEAGRLQAAKLGIKIDLPDLPKEPPAASEIESST